eukprot:3977129-Alexandrium_andersonii.AAC.1
MADQTLDLFTTTAKDITLSPGYSGSLGPALRAFAGSGEVFVKGALSQGGFVAFQGRKSDINALSTTGAIT